MNTVQDPIAPPAAPPAPRPELARLLGATPAFRRLRRRALRLREDLADRALDGRRQLRRARRAADDFVEESAHEVKRHPLRSVGLAALGGMVVGSMLVLLPAWRLRRR